MREREKERERRERGSEHRRATAKRGVPNVSDATFDRNLLVLHKVGWLVYDSLFSGLFAVPFSYGKLAP